MTEPDNRPCVPPVVGGIFRIRNGLEVGPLRQNEIDLCWNKDGSEPLLEHETGPSEMDLVELVAVAVPKQTYDVMVQHTKMVSEGVVVSTAEYREYVSARAVCEWLEDNEEYDQGSEPELLLEWWRKACKP